jgi:hypothetical protein
LEPEAEPPEDGGGTAVSDCDSAGASDGVALSGAAAADEGEDEEPKLLSPNSLALCLPVATGGRLFRVSGCRGAVSFWSVVLGFGSVSGRSNFDVENDCDSTAGLETALDRTACALFTFA